MDTKNISSHLSTLSVNDWLNHWLNNHITAIDMGLARCQQVFDALGINTSPYHVVMVAGTNGKGSTTATIASIYKAAGLTVGLYQSPHIFKFNERIKLNGQDVSDDDLKFAFEQVEQARLAVSVTLSFFEATTLAAFVLFAKKQCQVWVLEVGLGGRLDVVNLVYANTAVITNIGIDHTDWLGDTLEQISVEKAGIIKQNQVVVFGQGQPNIIIEQTATQLQNPYYILNQHVTDNNIPNAYSYSEKNDTLTYSCAGLTMSFDTYHLAAINVCAAVTAVLTSSQINSQLTVTSQQLLQGVAQAKVAGRFEIIKKHNHLLVLDVAHNPDGMQFLLQQIKKLMCQNTHITKVNFVFSMLADKDINQVVQLAGDNVNQWFIAPMQCARAATLEQLQAALHNLQYNTYQNLNLAYQAAISSAQSDVLTVVCGSFHVLEALWQEIHLD